MVSRDQRYSRMFFTVCSILLVIGLLFVYSSSSVYALDHCGSAHYYLVRHMYGIILGCIAAGFMRSIPLSWIRWMVPSAFFGSCIMTALTLIPTYALHIHGSSRWLKLYDFAFQPSELLKYTFILYCAHILAKTNGTITWRRYAQFLLLLGIVDLILLAQPDFGLAVTLSSAVALTLFIAGARIAYLLTTLCACIPLLIALIAYKPYRVQRIMTFLNPWSDPQGAGFQVIQSLIAIGSGGWCGVGIGNSKQKFFYLPMQHTDFIFSIIAEEVGFIGVMVLILLFILFLHSGLKIAYALQDPFSHYTVLGFVLLVTLQALINIAVATGMAPTKGIGLPFISYGNTALVCTIGMLGLIARMVRNNDLQQNYSL